MPNKNQKSKIKNQKHTEKVIHTRASQLVVSTNKLQFVICNLQFILLLIIFLIPGIIGLLHPGFPATDDGDWMLIRFAAFYETLRYGQFPVRFLMQLNHGYGYPVVDFLYPFFLYLGVPIHIVGFSFINTIKVILSGSFMISGIFTYLWFRKLFTPIASFVGALCYAFFPYHLSDIYQRGSVGEVVALAIVPFIFWQIEQKSKVYIAIGIACLILAHNTLAVLFLPIIVGYIFIKKVFSIRYIVFSIFLSLTLSAFFWLPALYDKQFTVFDATKVSDFSQYFITKNNFGLLGIFSVVIIMVNIAFVFKKYRKEELFFLLVTFIGIFFASSAFSIFWKILPLPQFVQFPFRFLSIVILGVAFLTAAMLNKMKSSLRIAIAVLCVFMIYAGAWNYLFPKVYQQYPDSFYATNQDTTTVKNEYMPKWVQHVPLEAPQNKAAIVFGNGMIADIIVNNANKIQFTAHISKPSIVRINTMYFPGWSILANNKIRPIAHYNRYGVMDVSLMPGDYSVVARFGETPIRLFADIISLISFILILGLLIRNWYRFSKFTPSP